MPSTESLSKTIFPSKYDEYIYIINTVYCILYTVFISMNEYNKKYNV